MVSASPLMYSAQGETRKAAACAISCGVPILPTGILDNSFLSASGLPQSLLEAPSVATGPGAMALTRILYGAHSTARVRVRASTPALAAAE